MASFVTPAVEVENLCFSYFEGRERRPVISDLSFNVEVGETLSVLGPSGCGKTTLLRLILGQLTPTTGRVRINASVSPAGVPGVSYIPQTPILLPWRTALQNATLNIELERNLNTPSLSRIEDDFKMFGLEGAEGRYPEELSGGMGQRVSLIRALSTDPKVVCADEPFSALDYLSRIDLNMKFKNRCDVHGISTIFVTHNIEEAVYLSRRILVLSKSSIMGWKILNLSRQFSENDPVQFRQTPEFLGNVRRVWDAIGGIR